MNPNWLADFFIKQRSVIEAAETPFAKLAVFILPVITPAVPAFMTGVHMYQLFIQIFSFDHADWVSAGMAGIIALSLELLGYVGAVSFIKSVFDWVRFRANEYILPLALNGLAYLFYLVVMFFINVRLGEYFGTPVIVNAIFGLLSFITVPSGLLAANHLNDIREEERAEKLRAEKRSDEILKYKIKHSRKSHSQPKRESQTNTKISKSKILFETNLTGTRAAVYNEMNNAYSKGRLLEPADLVAKGFEKSAVTRYRGAWLDDHPEARKFGF